MQDDNDSFGEKIEEKPEEKFEYEEEQIRISSDGSSPNLQDSRTKVADTKQFDLFDKMIASIPDKPAADSQEDVTVEQPINEANGKKENHSIIQQVEKQWIIKEAEMQRIGGTYDFFAYQIEKYRKHSQSRKSVLHNIYASIDKNKAMKAQVIIILKEYFKDLSSICEEFHEKSYKYEVPQREESDNKIINIRVELKAGFERLLSLRKNTGNDLSRLDKFIKSTTIAKIDKTIEVYWGSMGSHQNKITSKKEIFEEKEKKIIKRIDKITKLYNRGRIGTELEQDLFIEMTKFVREEKQLRQCLLQWGRQTFNLRRAIMNADFGLMGELQVILSEYKNFNNTIYQLKKKKFNFIERLKQQIESNYQYEKLCLPLDNDYILSIVNYRYRSSRAFLKVEDYQEFLNQEYFQDIIGDTNEFLKGTLIKTFPLKNAEEELIRTVSGNLIYYNKRTLEIKNKMKTVNTTAEFQGYGCVALKEIVKGIIFDSDNVQKVSFKDDNRAEELVLYLSGEFNTEQN